VQIWPKAERLVRRGSVPAVPLIKGAQRSAEGVEKSLKGAGRTHDRRLVVVDQFRAVLVVALPRVLLPAWVRTNFHIVTRSVTSTGSLIGTCSALTRSQPGALPAMPVALTDGLARAALRSCMSMHRGEGEPFATLTQLAR
jgi:hypothetical protein